MTASFYFCPFALIQKCCWNCSTLLCNRPVQSPKQQQPVLSFHFPWGGCNLCLIAPKKHHTVGCWCAGALFLLILLMVHRKDIIVVRAETRVHPWRDVGLVLPVALKWVHARLSGEAALCFHLLSVPSSSKIISFLCHGKTS